MGEQVLRVQRAVRVAHQLNRPVTVCSIRLLDQSDRAPEETTLVRGEPGVVARDANVLVGGVSVGLERVVQRTIEGRAGRLTVSDDPHRHSTLIGETLRHRKPRVRVVPQRHQLVSAYLRERVLGCGFS